MTAVVSEPSRRRRSTACDAAVVCCEHGRGADAVPTTNLIIARSSPTAVGPTAHRARRSARGAVDDRSAPLGRRNRPKGGMSGDRRPQRRDAYRTHPWPPAAECRRAPDNDDPDSCPTERRRRRRRRPGKKLPSGPGRDSIAVRAHQEFEKQTASHQRTEERERAVSHRAHRDTRSSALRRAGNYRAS